MTDRRIIRLCSWKMGPLLPISNQKFNSVLLQCKLRRKRYAADYKVYRVLLSLATYNDTFSHWLFCPNYPTHRRHVASVNSSPMSICSACTCCSRKIGRTYTFIYVLYIYTRDSQWLFNVKRPKVKGQGDMPQSSIMKYTMADKRVGTLVLFTILFFGVESGAKLEEQIRSQTYVKWEYRKCIYYWLELYKIHDAAGLRYNFRTQICIFNDISNNCKPITTSFWQNVVVSWG